MERRWDSSQCGGKTFFTDQEVFLTQHNSLKHYECLCKFLSYPVTHRDMDFQAKIMGICHMYTGTLGFKCAHVMTHNFAVTSPFLLPNFYLRTWHFYCFTVAQIWNRLQTDPSNNKSLRFFCSGDKIPRTYFALSRSSTVEALSYSFKQWAQSFVFSMHDLNLYLWYESVLVDIWLTADLLSLLQSCAPSHALFCWGLCNLSFKGTVSNSDLLFGCFTHLMCLVFVIYVRNKTD